MTVFPIRIGVVCGFFLVLNAWTGNSVAQSAVTAPAAGAPATVQVVEPKKPAMRRVARRSSRAVCQALDDPWGNLCVVRLKAQVACNDLPTPGKRAKVVRKGRGAQATPASIAGNPRQECVDAYMRNV